MIEVLEKMLAEFHSRGLTPFSISVDQITYAQVIGEAIEFEKIWKLQEAIGAGEIHDVTYKGTPIYVDRNRRDKTMFIEIEIEEEI